MLLSAGKTSPTILVESFSRLINSNSKCIDHSNCEFQPTGKVKLISLSMIDFRVLYEDFSDSSISHRYDISNITFSCPIISAAREEDSNILILQFKNDDYFQFEIWLRKCIFFSSKCLQFITKSRDIFFSGFYNGRHILENEGIQIVQKPTIDSTTVFRDSIVNIMQQYFQSLYNQQNRYFCVCCGYKKKTKSVKFYIHPYVSCKSDKEPIYLCTNCYNKFPKDKSNIVPLLITPYSSSADKKSDDFCAICASIPCSFLLCQLCPKTFCHRCLHLILLEDEKSILAHDTTVSLSWNCISCMAGKLSNISMSFELSESLSISTDFLTTHDTSSSSTSSSMITTNDNSDFYLSDNNISNDHSNIPSSCSHDISGTTSITTTTTCIPEDSGINNTTSSSDITDLLCNTTSTSSISPTTSNTKSKSIDKNNRNRNQISKRKLIKENPPKNKSKKSKVPTSQNDHFSLPPVDSSKSVDYYWNPYILSYERSVHSAITGIELPTEDVCFLCKDGGELVECDFIYHRNNNNNRNNNMSTNCNCKKVYHSYCANIPPDKKWFCPRHFCSYCLKQSESQMKYSCRYCPRSVCSRPLCLSSFSLVKHEVYFDTPTKQYSTNEFPKVTECIICKECQINIQQCDFSKNRTTLLNWMNLPFSRTSK